MHRRDFLTQGTTAFAGAALAQAGAKSRTSDKQSHYIDAHVHVWAEPSRQYPYREDVNPADVNPRNFPPEDILAYSRLSGVNRVVLIQMSWYGFDNSYMLDAIKRHPTVFRGIAIVDWKNKEQDPATKMKELTPLGVRGFRIYPENEPPDTCLDGEGLDKMFHCGAENNLSMCLLVNPDQLPAVKKRCERFPDTPVVIDHLARIGIAGPISESDVRLLCSLSRFPKVEVKVSAFYALGKKKPPHLDLEPFVKRVYDSFGPKRLMWGSDCPFQVQHESYEDSISLVRDRLRFLSAEDKDWVLRRTAEETFFV